MSFCGAQIHSDDHRCGRCGRRVSDEPVRPSDDAACTAGGDRAGAIPQAPGAETPPPRPGPQLVRSLPSFRCRAGGTGVSQTSLVRPDGMAPRGQIRHRDPVPQASVRRRPERSLQANFDSAPSMPGRTSLHVCCGHRLLCAHVAQARDRMVAARIT